MRYEPWLIYYYHYLDNNAEGRRWTPENHWKYRFCFLFGPEESGEIITYSKQKLIQYYKERTGKKYCVEICQASKMPQQMGILKVRVFEVEYGIEDRYFVRKKDLMCQKNTKKSIVSILGFMRNRHPGTFNHIYLFVTEKDNMTKKNIEEVILNKIPYAMSPNDPDDKMKIKIISIKEHVSVIQQ